MSECNKRLHTQKFGNPSEMCKMLERYKLPKLTGEEIENLIDLYKN